MILHHAILFSFIVVWVINKINVAVKNYTNSRSINNSIIYVKENLSIEMMVIYSSRLSFRKLHLTYKFFNSYTYRIFWCKKFTPKFKEKYHALTFEYQYFHIVSFTLLLIAEIYHEF